MVFIFLFLLLLILFYHLLNAAGAKSEIIDERLLQSISYFFIVIIIFVIQWGYFIFFEMAFNGKSLGKLILRIRVINHEGRFLSMQSSILRNFIRPIEILLGMGIISMMINKDLRRVGDLIAGTIVISENRSDIKIPDFSIKDMDSLEYDEVNLTKKLSEDDLYIIRTFLNSASKIDSGKREKIAVKIALAIKKKLNEENNNTDPISYLKSVYMGHKDE